MKISVIQTDLLWEDKPRNLQNLDKLISPLVNKTDIVVLSEMFNTGFSMNPEKLYESPETETFKWMIDLAQKGNFGLCGSYIIKENMHFFNRWIFVTPEKESWYYDKRHLFSIGKEDKFFTRGEKRLIFTFRGVRINPLVCYDLRFPVWSRNKNDCDLIICAANWPESRREAWNILLKARAIENQCYVAASNRIGTDGEGIVYSGDSMILDPRGTVLTSANTNEENSITGEISMTELSDYRKKFPALNDADTFTLNF